MTELRTCKLFTRYASIHFVSSPCLVIYTNTIISIVHYFCKAFNDQEIACNTLTVQDSGCAGTPTDSPVVTVEGLNSKAVISWTAVTGASKYQIFRTEGLEKCEQGKVKVATLSSNVLTYTDENIANGREYSYIVIPIGASESCFGPSSACTTVTPASAPEISLICDNGPLTLLIDPDQSPSTETRTCAVSGIGGFTGSVNIGCSPSSLTGVSCSTTPTTVSVSSTPTSVVLSIVPTSTASGSGIITVTASDGSLSSNSIIPISVMTAGEAQTAVFDNDRLAPRCALYGSECSSGDLLVGRGSMTGGNEANAPNTIGNSCSDGDAGEYGTDESIERIVVRSGSENGDGAGAVMTPGGRATITATVHAWGSGEFNLHDFRQHQLLCSSHESLNKCSFCRRKRQSRLLLCYRRQYILDIHCYQNANSWRIQ